MIFTHEFFDFTNDKNMYESGKRSKTLLILSSLFRNKIFIFFLTALEWILTKILTLPIPIYSDLILMIITNLPGLPRLTGCYIRSIYYKGIVKHMASNILIEQGVNIAHPEKMELSEFCFLDKNVIIAANSCKIGKRVHIAPYVIITGGGDFEIGDYACIANHSSIITSTETLKNGTRASGPMLPFIQRDVLRGFVKIKKDAFIGTKSTVLTNVVIAEGTVIGANTVITKSTEPWKYYIQSGGKAMIFKEREKLNLPDL